MAKDLIQVSARNRGVLRQEEVIATPGLPKEGYVGDAHDKAPSTVNRLPSGIKFRSWKCKGGLRMVERSERSMFRSQLGTSGRKEI